MTGLPKLAVGGQMWKIFTAGMGVIALILVGLLVKANIENRSITKERDKLERSIADPETGYIVRLKTSRDNVITLEGAVKRQNDAFTAQSQAARKEMERLRGELNRSEAAKNKAVVDSGKFLANKPKGDTLEKRIQDVDQKILKDLNQ